MSRTRQTLTEVVFPALRRRGFIARANFSCCGGCGHAELSQVVAEKEKVGHVFWHCQDEDRLRDAERGRESWEKEAGLHLRFDANEGLRAITAAEAGEAVAQEAMLAGLEVDWNGDPNIAVWVGVGGR